MTVRGVIFDMGGTLLHYNPPEADWEDTEKTGARGVYQRLHQAGYALPPEPEALDIAWQHALAVWGNLSSYDVEDLKLDRQIELLARKWGVSGVAPDLLPALSLAYMTH